MTNGETKVLSVLMPVYNEAPTLEEILGRMLRVDLSALGLRRQLIIVDDGSTDGSDEIARRFLADHPEQDGQMIALGRNRGKGHALHRALAAATGEFCLVQDADLEYDPQDWLHLLPPLVAGETEVVFGSRQLPLGPDQRRRRVYKIGLMAAHWLISLLYGHRFTDVATCYKAFRTELLRSLELEREGFDFCPEVAVKLVNRGVPIRETPISYRPRYKEEGKKIRWHDFFSAMYTIVRYRFRDPGRKANR